jgi:hypothetical protein
MRAFKQFSIVLFLASFLFGLLFDVVNREMPRDWIPTTSTLEQVQEIITKAFSSTFEVDKTLASGSIR